ncbi:MAG TPA: hypothetical protein VFS00_22220, partial [Polyangiaceae bacterium]|nr:hypothetical protein [Polyangiaceae bacterium]
MSATKSVRPARGPAGARGAAAGAIGVSSPAPAGARGAAALGFGASRLAPALAALAFAAAWLAPSVGLAEPKEPCRFRVETDDAAPNRKAAATLRRDAERLGLCQRSWVIKLTRTQPGTYTIALWTTSELETRSTDDAGQIVPVSQLLLRVAVERAEAPP